MGAGGEQITHLTMPLIIDRRQPALAKMGACIRYQRGLVYRLDFSFPPKFGYKIIVTMAVENKCIPHLPGVVLLTTGKKNSEWKRKVFGFDFDFVLLFSA